MQTPTDTSSPASSTTKNKLPPNYNLNAKGVMGEFWKTQERRVCRENKIEKLDYEIGRLNRSINASSYQLLLLIREFDERAGWLKWSFTDGVSWLKWRCDLGTGTAREKLRIAHALKELPLISEAFCNGNLSYSKVRVMTRVATAENEADLIALAKRMTVQHLTEHCKQRSNAQKASTAIANAAQNSREFRVWHDTAKGTMHFSVELPVEEGELMEKAVEKAAVRLSSEVGLSSIHGSQSEQFAQSTATMDKEPSWSAMQADAVVDIMRGFLSGDAVGSESSSDTPTDKPASSSSADHHLVMIHVDESVLLNRSANNSLSNSTPASRDLSPCASDEFTQSNPDYGTSQYPIETVRRLCCDGSIAPIIENGKGEPLHVGRRVRTLTTAIRRALWSRDGGCAFPGCDHKRFVDAHHIKHWADGGETSVENLVLLCSSHHKLVHEGGFQIGRDQTEQLFFRRPDGKAVPHCWFYREDWVDEDSEDTYQTYQTNNENSISEPRNTYYH